MPQIRERADHLDDRDKAEITVQQYESELRDLPPSAKLVAKTLEEGEKSQQIIAEESLLPGRTVRYALRRLKEEDVVASRASLGDPRKEIYRLRGSEDVQRSIQ